MKRFAAATAAIALALVAGCSADKVLNVANTGSASPVASAAPASSAADAGPPPANLPAQALTESDFSESERNRDPFRSFAAAFVSDARKTTTPVQKEVLLGEHALDELKLVAIVRAGDYPRAMVVDPSGKGWVLKKGDWVGRPEIVHVGGPNGTDYQINWRVSKVREGDIVFTREDPAHPGVPPASRVIALRPDGEGAREKL